MAYYVYLLASKKHGTLYLGVTNDIVRRVYEHRIKAGLGDPDRYPPLTAPAVKPATIWRCANTVNSSTGRVTINAAAASGPQLNWS